MKRNHKISQAHDVDYHIMKAYRTKMSKNVLFSTKLMKNQKYFKIFVWRFFEKKSFVRGGALP